MTPICIKNKHTNPQVDYQNHVYTCTYLYVHLISPIIWALGGIYIYNNMIITKYMYNIKHTSFQPQVKLYMYNEYYVKKHFTEREIVSWNSTTSDDIIGQ